jgi:hypothetical protein
MEVDVTLAAAIKLAGGVSEFGDSRKIKLVRKQKVIGTFNLNELEKNPAMDPILMSGDQVVVPE